MANFIKRVMLKQRETKHKTNQQENVQLNHNSPYDKIVWSPLSQIAQGDMKDQRSGDEIIGSASFEKKKPPLCPDEARLKPHPACLQVC